MVWIALGSVGVAALIAATFLPSDAIREARRLALRSDGTTSQTRASIEANHARRAVRNGLVVPLVLMTAVGVGIAAVHELTPWSRAATVFGSNTAETATVSDELVGGVRDGATAPDGSPAGATARPPAQGTIPSVGTPMDAGHEQTLSNFLLTHWPLHPVFLVLLGLALWRVYRRAASQHRVYMDGVRARQRQYQRRDLQLASTPEGTDDGD